MEKINEIYCVIFPIYKYRCTVNIWMFTVVSIRIAIEKGLQCTSGRVLQNIVQCTLNHYYLSSLYKVE